MNKNTPLFKSNAAGGVFWYSSLLKPFSAEKEKKKYYSATIVTALLEDKNDFGKIIVKKYFPQYILCL
jgi:hypothetical protein